MHDGIVTPELFFSSDEAWLYLGGHEHPLHHIKIRV
jgi:hypothetical protein